MMNKLEAAARQALEALENHPGNYKLSKAECVKYNAVEAALREALAEQQAAEPAIEVEISPMSTGGTTATVWSHRLPVGTHKLYTHPAPTQQPVGADELKEPKNGAQWRVEWWNESCRMMLPSDARLTSFNVYRNGTIQFTIKKSDDGITGSKEGGVA